MVRALARALSWGVGWWSASLLLACGEAPESSPSRDEPVATPSAEGAEAERRDAALAELTRFEDTRRAQTDFATVAPWSEASGANPFRVRTLASGAVLGLLRGRGELAVLDPASLVSVSVLATHPDATGWDLSPDGDTLYVVGPRQADVQRVEIRGGATPTLVERDRFSVVETVSLRDVAVSRTGTVALADGYAHRIMVVRPPQSAGRRVQPVFFADCGGPLRLQWVSDQLLALCSLDHRVLAWRVGDNGIPEGQPRVIQHDGPMWSMDAVALPDGSGVRVAIGGVEDKALDRSDGSFGHIDSFAFVVDLPAQGPPVRRAALNVSEHHVITPKWIALAVDGDTTEVSTVGYGDTQRLTARWETAAWTAPDVTSTAWLPGVTDVVALGDGRQVAADPLLDAWLDIRGETVTVVGVADPSDARTPEVRLGEALLFTGLMAPASRTEGKASRFTCETCHFEGGVDGRVHWTGRGQVHAATRSIRGLFNNRPHFSRALDTTMAQMADNEFRVASKGTGADPWFVLDPSDTPWVKHLGVTAPADGTDLRRAFMAFVMTFSHEPNPRALAGNLDPEAVDAAEFFEVHCETCHAARLVADDPTTRVPRAEWMNHIGTKQSAIVWGSDTRHRTGVLPYVHEDGARVPSLRRLFSKRPYFTDGGAPTLQQAARRFSIGVEQHVRDATGGRTITELERQAVQRFLELL